MDVVRLVDSKILSVVEKIFAVLEGGIDYRTFEAQLKKELDGLGRDLLKVVIEALDQQLSESKERKQKWVVVRKNDRKEILTPFGLLSYERRYYRNKESKEYSYLVDEKVGIKPHSRVSVSVKADLVEASTVSSYEETTLQVSRHNSELKVSRQAVAACVKEFKVKEAPHPQQKRRVAVLYLAADEDHLKVRRRGGAQARLIYIYEGVEHGSRRRLKNARYFTAVGKSPEEFWLEVCDYIAANYELESLEKIYLSGDGANWIRVGLQFIPGVTFILDKFHLFKHITMATAHAPELKRPIYRGIWKLNQQAVIEHLQEALRRAEERPRQKRILDTIRYIKNNWDGIESQVKHPHVSCSAENHVSHILSARLSSRPMAWSLKGADRMAAMRAVKANAESVREHYLSMHTNAPVLVELKEEVQRELKRLRQRQTHGLEYLNNVPLFRSGSNFTRMVLKQLNEKSVV